MVGNISKTRGVLGATGPQGPQGEQGPQGVQGEKGDIPSVVLRYDKETGNLYYSSDGILVDKDYVNSQNLVTKADLETLDLGDSGKVNALNYYGDANIVPSDSDIFIFTTDDETMTASVIAANPLEIEGNIVVPYIYVVNDKIYTVTSIGEYDGNTGFEYCDRITSVIIPKSITTIPSMTFRNCTSLTSVKLPETLTTIGDNAFQGCESLESIEIPDSVSIIDYDAFTYCTSLNNVILPDRIKVIPNGVFSGCSALSNVKFADDIIAIDGSAFYGTALTNINIPDTVIFIGQNAFARSDLKSITIPDGITNIPDMAFYECTGLTSVTIPASVTEIVGWAFRGCEALTDVYFKGTKEQWDAITIGEYNDVLSTATIHYNRIEADVAPFVVNVTAYADGTLELDKTDREISSAYDDGKTILAYVKDYAGDIVISMGEDAQILTLVKYERVDAMYKFCFANIDRTNTETHQVTTLWSNGQIVVDLQGNVVDNGWRIRTTTLASEEYVDNQIGEIEKLGLACRTTFHLVSSYVYHEYVYNDATYGTGTYLKVAANNSTENGTIRKLSYDGVSKQISWTTMLESLKNSGVETVTSPSGVTDCILMGGGAVLNYDTENDTFILNGTPYRDPSTFVPVLWTYYDAIGGELYESYLPTLQEQIVPLREKARSTPLTTLCVGMLGKITFDSKTRTMFIPSDTGIIYEKDGVYNTIAMGGNTTITFGTSTSNWRVVFDVETRTIKAIPYSQQISDNEIVVCVVRAPNNGSPISPSISCPYMLDGNLYGIDVNAELQQTIDHDSIMKSIAHRGLEGTAPENTLTAIRMAKAAGFNYVEFDVRFTSDGIPVLCHDATIDRTSNGTGAVAEMTFEELRTYDFGSWKNAAYAGEKIPSFEEALLLCRNLNIKPYIEIKFSSPTTEQIQQLIDTVKRYGMSGKETWVCFAKSSLEKVRDVDPKARIGYTFQGDNETGRHLTDDDIAQAKTLKTDTNEVFISLYQYTMVSEDVQKCIDNDMPLELWTVWNKEQVVTLNSLYPWVSGMTVSMPPNVVPGKVLYEHYKSNT